MRCQTYCNENSIQIRNPVRPVEKPTNEVPQTIDTFWDGHGQVLYVLRGGNLGYQIAAVNADFQEVALGLDLYKMFPQDRYSCEAIVPAFNSTTGKLIQFLLICEDYVSEITYATPVVNSLFTLKIGSKIALNGVYGGSNFQYFDNNVLFILQNQPEKRNAIFLYYVNESLSSTNYFFVVDHKSFTILYGLTLTCFDLFRSNETTFNLVSGTNQDYLLQGQLSIFTQNLVVVTDYQNPLQLRNYLRPKNGAYLLPDV